MKKVALTVVAGVLLAGGSFVFAQPYQGGGFNQRGNCYFNNGNCYNGYGMNGGKMRMFNKGYGCGGYGMNYYNGNMGNGGMYGGGFMFFNNLNLTPEQRHNISILRDEMRLEMKKTLNPKYFSNNKFDKNMYMKNTKEYDDKRLEIQAEYMEKAYNLLTKEQKEMLDDIMN